MPLIGERAGFARPRRGKQLRLIRTRRVAPVPGRSDPENGLRRQLAFPELDGVGDADPELSRELFLPRPAPQGVDAWGKRQGLLRSLEMRGKAISG